MRRVVWFTVACAGALAAVIVGAWAIVGFATFGMHGAPAIALVLGVVFSCVVGIGLMALIFYSERSGQDETVHNVHKIHHPDRD